MKWILRKLFNLRFYLLCVRWRCPLFEFLHFYPDYSDVSDIYSFRVLWFEFVLFKYFNKRNYGRTEI